MLPKTDIRLSVVTMLYGRINGFADQLDLMSKQTLESTWEWVVWNNNPDRAGDIQEIIDSSNQNFDIILINSTVNFHCLARQAVAPLCRGEFILFMDDDILPQPEYLEYFLQEYLRIESESNNEYLAISACGHWFDESILGSSAEDVWETRKGLNFYNQEAPQSEIHFLHANTCFLRRTLFLKVCSLPLPAVDFTLVDDYWTSYVLSNEFGTTLIKVECDGVFEFRPDAFDPDVAMFYRSDVHEARLRFFAYHSARGWPYFHTE